MAYIPEGTEMRHMVPAQNRVLWKIKILDFTSQRRINTDDPFLESDIHVVRDLLREHGDYLPAEMLHVETSDVEGKVPVTRDKSVMPAQENPVPTNSTGFPPIQLKPTSTTSREMIDDSGIPKKISQQGLLNLSGTNSLDSFASASTLMTEVAKRQADLNAMGNSTATSSSPKRQKRNVTPEIPVPTLPQKRESKAPVRYGDAALAHTNVKKVPVPSTPNDYKWTLTSLPINPDLALLDKIEGIPFPSASGISAVPAKSSPARKLIQASDSSSDSVTENPSPVQRKNQVTFDENIVQLEPTSASANQKDNSTEQETPGVTVIGKIQNKIRKTLNLELSCTTIDTPADTSIMPTSTQFGKFCENQRVLALKNDGDNFFCPGKIIQKSVRKGKWIVSFGRVQKVLSQEEIIPINVLGNGVCGFYRNLAQGEAIIPNTDVVILAHAKSNKIPALRYSIEYVLYGKDGYGWVDWTEIEVHGKELTRLLEEWRQQNQQIETAAQNLGNASAPAPPESLESRTE